MGKKNPGKAIKPVDPVALTQAQSTANTQTAQQQQQMNMVSSYGPDGSVRYVADPSAPGGYAQVTSLSPGQQYGYDIGNISQNQLRNQIAQSLGQPVDMSGLTAIDMGNIQDQYNQSAQPFQYSFDQGGQVQGQVGGDLNAARQQAIDATYAQATSRLDPRFARDETSMQTKLANQGLSANSDAYRNAEDQFGQTKNDAYNQAQYSSIAAGEDAAQNLFARQLGQGQFANQAVAQQYGQNQGLAQFNNDALGQETTQNRDAAQFTNDAAGQRFSQSLAANQNDFSQLQWQTQLPYQQLAALQASGVQMPQGIGYTPTQVNPTDVMGAYALNQQGQVAKANANATAQGGMMSGLFSLGSAAIMASDERLKTDIRPIETRPDGVEVVSFRYKTGGPTFIGVIAQQLKKIRPDLVLKGPGGMLAVNYVGLA